MKINLDMKLDLGKRVHCGNDFYGDIISYIIDYEYHPDIYSISYAVVFQGGDIEYYPKDELEKLNRNIININLPNGKRKRKRFTVIRVQKRSGGKT